HMLAQKLRPTLRCFEVAIDAGQHISRRKAIDHARNGIGLLARAGKLLPLQCQARAKVAVVDGAIGELRVEVEFSKRADLSNPPVGRLKAIFIRVTADKDDALSLKLYLAGFRVKDAAGKQVLAGRDYA